jgi:hypothetical protein
MEKYNKNLASSKVPSTLTKPLSVITRLHTRYPDLTSPDHITQLLSSINRIILSLFRFSNGVVMAIRGG